MVLVGEMRDNETISLALTAAETGLLVLGTLHTKSAAQTINRVVDAFSVGSTGPGADGPFGDADRRREPAAAAPGGRPGSSGRAGDPRAHAGDLQPDPGVEGRSRSTPRSSPASQLGMQKLEHHLRELVARNVVTAEEAAVHAENPQEFLTVRKDAPAGQRSPAPRDPVKKAGWTSSCSSRGRLTGGIAPEGIAAPEIPRREAGHAPPVFRGVLRERTGGAPCPNNTRSRGCGSPARKSPRRS